MLGSICVGRPRFHAAGNGEDSRHVGGFGLGSAHLVLEGGSDCHVRIPAFTGVDGTRNADEGLFAASAAVAQGRESASPCGISLRNHPLSARIHPDRRGMFSKETRKACFSVGDEEVRRRDEDTWW